MISSPAVVRLRLSASQMSVIWPGIERIVKRCSVPNGKPSLYSFPAHLYSLPSRFNWGQYNIDLMNVINDLRNRLRTKARNGGRVQMHAIEIRAAIFAIRVELDWWRREKHDRRKYSARSKRVLGVNAESLANRKRKAQRVIRTLERHLKRANSRLLSAIGREAYNAVASAWRSHIRWIRLHRVYFKPMRFLWRPGKQYYQIIINELQRLAEIAIAEEKFELPAPEELRRVIRLYASSARRDRQGHFDIPTTLKGSELAKCHLIDFIEKRLELKPLSEK